tara:strand:+ start:457 stop:891 length:435 start_codon:yes stop_codon:yes gene_type:complete
MAWPANANNIVTTNLDAGADNPASARPNLKAALDEITNLINGRNQASGVAGLDSSSKIANTQLPDTIVSSSSAELTLTPHTGQVKINSVLELNGQTRAQLYDRTDLADGMIAMASNGDSTATVPVYYSGGAWRYFSNNTEVVDS